MKLLDALRRTWEWDNKRRLLNELYALFGTGVPFKDQVGQLSDSKGRATEMVYTMAALGLLKPDGVGDSRTWRSTPQFRTLSNIVSDSIKRCLVCKVKDIRRPQMSRDQSPYEWSAWESELCLDCWDTKRRETGC